MKGEGFERSAREGQGDEGGRVCSRERTKEDLKDQLERDRVTKEEEFAAERERKEKDLKDQLERDRMKKD